MIEEDIMFEITLPLPPSVNESYAVVRGRKILAKKARDWKLISSYKARSLFMMTGKIKTVVNFTFPDNRKRDQSNYIKQLYDLFPIAGVIKDDSQIVEEHIYSKVVKGVREVHIKIEEIGL
jgi:Holliday junction resolvase RusA-like endonuclease